MAADVRTLVDHFFGAAKTYVASSADALKSGDMSAFKATVSQVAGLPVVRQIANAISTSKAEMERFETFVKDAGPFGEIILGLTTTTAGALLWTAAADVAVALGVAASSGFLVLLAYILIAVGVLIALKGAYALVLSQLKAIELSDLTS